MKRPTARTLDAIAIELLAGAPWVLQRISRAWSVPALLRAISARLGAALPQVEGPFTALPLAACDARMIADFTDWEPRRALPAETQRLVLLDAASGDRLLQQAPQFASYAGGVRLPLDPAIRVARTRAEEKIGEDAFARALSEDPDFAARNRDRFVSVLLGSSALIEPREPCSAIERVLQRTDDGIVYNKVL
jgi:hypothetical protein